MDILRGWWRGFTSDSRDAGDRIWLKTCLHYVADLIEYFVERWAKCNLGGSFLRIIDLIESQMIAAASFLAIAILGRLEYKVKGFEFAAAIVRTDSHP